VKQPSTVDVAPLHSPVEAARVAIWRLFEEGYVDEDMATAGLLAVDIGARRTQQQKRIASIGQAHSPIVKRRQLA
jgi:hypothetical protein